MTSAIVYLNGRHVPAAEASIGIEDRGFQFADSVYEVVLVVGGRLVDRDGHMERLSRSMDRMAFASRPDIAGLTAVLDGLPGRNGISDGMVYVQVTRGAWARNMSPGSAPDGTPPTIVAYARALAIPRRLAAMRPLHVLSAPDRRWGHCDIKTTALAGNMLARAQAQAAGADEAWLVAADGTVTEATAANAWIVRDGVIHTRAEGPEILGGITRRRILALAQDLGIPTRIAAFRPADVAAADEAFQTSATALITPLASIDGVAKSDPAGWPVSTMLFDAYMRFAGAD